MILLYSKNQPNFEFEYIKNLLLDYISIEKEIVIENIADKNDEMFYNNHLVFIFSAGDKYILKAVTSFIKNRKFSYSLIHLSDERLTDEISLYKEAKVVLRNYFNPFIFTKNTFTIPLGFQTGFLTNHNFTKEEFKRNYVWSFAGQIYRKRKNMIKQLQFTNKYFLHQTTGFNLDDALESKILKEVYFDSIFAPCPFGYTNPDSFRIMEVLESGCIPIVQKYFNLDYYKIIFGNHPFLVVNNWNEVEKNIQYYLENNDRLLEKQFEVHQWYKLFKINLQKDIKNLFDGNISDLNSAQFKYQMKKTLHLKFFINFFFNFKIKNKNIYIKFTKSIYKIKRKIKDLLDHRG
jgi:hypothetical protein